MPTFEQELAAALARQEQRAQETLILVSRADVDSLRRHSSPRGAPPFTRTGLALESFRAGERHALEALKIK